MLKKYLFPMLLFYMFPGFVALLKINFLIFVFFSRENVSLLDKCIWHFSSSVITKDFENFQSTIFRFNFSNNMQLTGWPEYVSMIYLPIILVGLVGNGLSLYVYTTPNMRKSTVAFLLYSLSICDIFVLLFALPLYSISYLPIWLVCNIFFNWF